MAKLDSPRDLLIEELKDLHNAESQLLKALPKMAKAASSDELKEAFTQHLEETQGHVTRLEEIFETLGIPPKGKKCLAMEGLIAEGSEMMEEDAIPEIKDLALIVAAQKIEHYEIAGYGSCRALSELMGENDIADQLQMTLDEEGETDKKLTEIAESIELPEDMGEEDEEEESPSPKSKPPTASKGRR